MQYLLPAIRVLLKMKPRFYNGIRLGRNRMTNESIIGIAGKVIRARARTVRRQVHPDKYNRQLMDTIIAYTWTSPTPTQALQPAMLPLANLKAASYAIGTQTAGQQATSTQTTDTNSTTTTKRSNKFANTTDNSNTPSAGHVINGNVVNFGGAKTSATSTASNITNKEDQRIKRRSRSKATKDATGRDNKSPKQRE